MKPLNVTEEQVLQGIAKAAKNSHFSCFKIGMDFVHIHACLFIRKFAKMQNQISILSTAKLIELMS